MIGRIKAKLKSRAGESIAETLIALLISSLALLMLAGAVTSASRVVNLSKAKMADYYDKDAALAEFKGSGSATVTLTDADTLTELQVFKDLGESANNAFANNVVVRYVAE